MAQGSRTIPHRKPKGHTLGLYMALQEELDAKIYQYQRRCGVAKEHDAALAIRHVVVVVGPHQPMLLAFDLIHSRWQQNRVPPILMRPQR